MPWRSMTCSALARGARTEVSAAAPRIRVLRRDNWGCLLALRWSLTEALRLCSALRGFEMPPPPSIGELVGQRKRQADAISMRSARLRWLDDRKKPLASPRFRTARQKPGRPLDCRLRSEPALAT